MFNSILFVTILHVSRVLSYSSKSFTRNDPVTWPLTTNGKSNFPFQEKKVQTSTTTRIGPILHSHNPHQNIPNEINSSHWHVWKTADTLERNGLSVSSSCAGLLENKETTQKLVEKVIMILRLWGEEWAGQKEWQGVLNKSSLLHEIEESIVTLGFLMEFMDHGLDEKNALEENPITIIDVCSGKGIFSMLASYVFRNNGQVSNIIMLDKAEIRWHHVDIVNNNAKEECRPTIETWQCNLHEVDNVVNRLESIQSPLAMIGIHLCKTLSPTCIGIVNQLTNCPFFVLAPCCLPRAVMKGRNTILLGNKSSSVIEIRQFETAEEKESRRLAKKRRDAAMIRRPQQSSPRRPLFMSDQIDLFDNDEDARLESAACWKCGMFGHLKADCPSTQTTGKPQLVKPPVAEIDVSHVLNSQKPFDTYCEVLSTSIQRNNVTVVDTGLVNDKVKHQKGNWNNGRKSLYIVST